MELKNGMLKMDYLVCESGPDKKYGYLATEKFYKNFDLTLEFLQEATVTAVYSSVQQLKVPK